jgi:hypothetical protein
MQPQSYLSIQRIRQWVGRIRALDVYVDGQKVGSLASGESRLFPLVPGQHSIYVKMDWYKSVPLTVSVQTGETISLECGSPIRGWKVLGTLIYLFFPDKWWYVRPAG